MNISHRFVAQENLRHGKGPGLFNVEQSDTCGNGCGESCECNGDMSDFWGYDADTHEPVNLLNHVTAGKTGFDEDWRVVTQHTIHELYALHRNKNGQFTKKGKGKGEGKGKGD